MYRARFGIWGNILHRNYNLREIAVILAIPIATGSEYLKIFDDLNK